MKVADILLLSDINVPNNLQNGIKIMFLNEICKQLYREYPFPDEVYPFITVPGQMFYQLPEDCSEDSINMIQIGSQTYDSRTLEELDYGNTWTIVADQISLSPVPSKAELSYIYFRPQPPDFTEADMQSEPLFPEDFREALVYGISKRIAVTLSPPNLQLAAYFGEEMDTLVEFARKKLQIKSRKRVAIYRQWV